MSFSARWEGLVHDVNNIHILYTNFQKTDLSAGERTAQARRSRWVKRQTIERLPVNVKIVVTKRIICWFNKNFDIIFYLFYFVYCSFTDFSGCLHYRNYYSEVVDRNKDQSDMFFLPNRGIRCLKEATLYVPQTA